MGVVSGRHEDEQTGSSGGRHAVDVLRRPKSLVYLQGLKWVAQAKERVR